MNKAATTEDGFTYDFVASGNAKMSLAFKGCKLKADEWCTMTSTVTFGNLTETESDVFRVTGDGMTFE